jgi:hypothetical protein
VQPENDPPKRIRDSALSTAVLGSLALLVGVLTLFKSTGAANSGKIQQNFGAPIGPQQAPEVNHGLISGPELGSSETPKDSSEAQQPTKKTGKWKILQRVGIVAGIFYAMVNFAVWRAMVNSNELTRRAFEIAERSYITLGRKDGILGELIETDDPQGWPTILLYLQNAGHLPAQTVCVSTQITGWPIFRGPADQNNPLMRGIGFNSKGQPGTYGSACPAVGGDSVYTYVISRFFTQETLNRIRAEKLFQFSLSGYVQQCDSFGHYACKIFFLEFRGKPLILQEISELSCTDGYGAVPDLPPQLFLVNDPLPPCLGDDPKTQESQLAFLKKRVAMERRHHNNGKRSGQR